MQSPTFSAREQRLTTMSEELRRQEHLAQIRRKNAEQGLADELGRSSCTSQIDLDAYRAERDLARQALSEIHERQSRCLIAQDRHARGLPSGTLLLILNSVTGEQHVIERRDGDDSPDGGTWYRLDAPDDPMTFDTAIGADAEAFNLYSAEEVDDILDRAEIDDLFAN